MEAPSKKDQCTQCDFPILLRTQGVLKRFHTSGDLKGTLTKRPLPTLTHQATRPRSLHLPLEAGPGRLRLSPTSSAGTLTPATARLVPLDRPSSRGSSEPILTDHGRRERSLYDSSAGGGPLRIGHSGKWPTTPPARLTPLSPMPFHQLPPLRESCSSSTITHPSRNLHMSRAKLRATAATSELLSGFAMIAMVELQVNQPTGVPEWLLVVFAVCTTTLVAVHTFALMISTYLLPDIDAQTRMPTGMETHRGQEVGSHIRMRGFVELAWTLSTVLGLFLFLVEIAILCWVKFWDYSFNAAMAATIIVIPVLIIFVAFAIHFYHSLVIQKFRSTKDNLNKLEEIKKSLDQATSPV